MLSAFLGQCAPDAAFFSISSLNDTVPSCDDEGGGNAQEVGDVIADPTVDIEGDIDHRRLIGEVRRFVYGLSPHLRCIVFRHYCLGHSQAQIAADLGVTRSAVCHALRRVYRLERVEANEIQDSLKARCVILCV